MGPQCWGPWGAAGQGGGVVHGCQGLQGCTGAGGQGGVWALGTPGLQQSTGTGWFVGAGDPTGAPEQGPGVLTVPLTTPCLCFLQWVLLGCSSGFVPKSLPHRRFRPLSFLAFTFVTLQAAPETRGLWSFSFPDTPSLFPLALSMPAPCQPPINQWWHTGSAP